MRFDEVDYVADSASEESDHGLEGLGAFFLSSCRQFKKGFRLAIRLTKKVGAENPFEATDVAAVAALCFEFEAGVTQFEGADHASGDGPAIHKQGRSDLSIFNKNHKDGFAARVVRSEPPFGRQGIDIIFQDDWQRSGCVDEWFEITMVLTRLKDTEHNRVLFHIDEPWRCDSRRQCFGT